MIEVQNLSKRYGPVEAVRDVSFSVGTDQVLGLLGPNGAGKTTIMKILTGYHFPSSGTALIDGIPVDEDPVEVKKRIGYLPEGVPLYSDLSVREYLSFAAGARLVRKEERKQAVENSISACGLSSMAHKKIEALSKGYKQRVGLAQAIIHDPSILILDEPTTGLDPNQIIEIRNLIKDLGKRKTVILSTHILQEVEAVCSRVLILNEGRIAAQGTAEEIAGTMKGRGADTWELRLKGPSLSSDDIRQVLSGLEGGGREISSFNSVASQGAADLSFMLSSLPQGDDSNLVDPADPADPTDPADPAEEIFDILSSSGYKILRMNTRRYSLEDIFVKLTREDQK